MHCERTVRRRRQVDFLKGMDISSLPEVERFGGKFYDNGKEEDLLRILKAHGVNSIRVRVWNDPFSEKGEPYGGGGNTLPVSLALAERASLNGMSVLLDLHYSDAWTDPGKQVKPKAWEGLSFEEMLEKVGEFTEKCVSEFLRAGIDLTMVQVGNEITNGLLWPDGKTPNFKNIVRILRAGILGVKRAEQNAKDSGIIPRDRDAIRIMLHLDNGGRNDIYRNWFDSYFSEGGEDFDVIGLSFYPFWHGTLEDLRENLSDIAVRYGKDLIIAETSMGFTLEDYSSREGLDPKDRKGMAATKELADRVKFPMTPEGQKAYMEELVRIIRSVPGGRGKGYYYWEPAWLPVPGSEWATEAGIAYMKEKGPGGNEWANLALFDYEGNALPALDVI